MIKKTQDIKKGDQLPGAWTALEDARPATDAERMDGDEQDYDCVAAKVQYLPDGGIGLRVWPVDIELRLVKSDRKPRPDFCPNCGHSTKAHTGTYCQECGEDLT